ncbi:MAG: relaxase/mobilization nuclease domain-containing protein [Eggerthellaceae bacterium]|nr:relaxase/mobilization nuclease domain-containing protein [Eggerthellaceae bacterium]
MPILKPISGHTSCRGPYRYLTKEGRALACDYINLENPDIADPASVFNWARIMDATRRSVGNDQPWRGKRARTYKHYIVSPDPGDAIPLPALRELAVAWAQKHFGDYQVAIVYHDDNARGIPHAHVVVNNTNVFDGRRLQDPDPRGLNHSLQDLAEERRLLFLRDEREAGESPAHAALRQPKSLQAEYVRRAEIELANRGEYSWTADIRSRVRIARSLADTEAEFRNVLEVLGVEVSDNSAKAPRADWIYRLAEHPNRCIGGERLGLNYGKEHLQAVFGTGGTGMHSDAARLSIERIARNAVEVRNLDELHALSCAVTLMENHRIECLDDLEALDPSDYRPAAWTDPSPAELSDLVAYIERSGILPEHAQETPARRPASRRQEQYARGRGPARHHGEGRDRQRDWQPPRREERTETQHER